MPNHKNEYARHFEPQKLEYDKRLNDLTEQISDFAENWAVGLKKQYDLIKFWLESRACSESDDFTALNMLLVHKMEHFLPLDGLDVMPKDLTDRLKAFCKKHPMTDEMKEKIGVAQNAMLKEKITPVLETLQEINTVFDPETVNDMLIFLQDKGQLTQALISFFALYPQHQKHATEYLLNVIELMKHSHVRRRKIEAIPDVFSRNMHTLLLESEIYYGYQALLMLMKHPHLENLREARKRAPLKIEDHLTFFLVQPVEKKDKCYHIRLKMPFKNKNTLDGDNEIILDLTDLCSDWTQDGWMHTSNQRSYLPKPSSTSSMSPVLRSLLVVMGPIVILFVVVFTPLALLARTTVFAEQMAHLLGVNHPITALAIFSVVVVSAAVVSMSMGLLRTLRTVPRARIYLTDIMERINIPQHARSPLISVGSVVIVFATLFTSLSLMASTTLFAQKLTQFLGMSDPIFALAIFSGVAALVVGGIVMGVLQASPSMRIETHHATKKADTMKSGDKGVSRPVNGDEKDLGAEAAQSPDEGPRLS